MRSRSRSRDGTSCGSLRADEDGVWTSILLTREILAIKRSHVPVAEVQVPLGSVLLACGEWE